MSQASVPIEGKVAQVLNRREVALNVGSSSGVVPGMKFAILNKRALNIRDPDTREPLGSIDLPKALVKVVRVNDKVSVARTFRTTKRNIGGDFSLGLRRALEQPRWVEVPETLKVDEHSYQQEIEEKDSIVKIGDPVVEIRGDEYDVVETS